MPEPTSPADRTARALAALVGESRPRVAADGTDPHIPVAATVVVLRDSPTGPRVLMIERPDRGSFAGAWVFPGGKVEPADRAAEHEPEEEAARRAAVRETSEETGLSIDADALETISCWDPPPGIALRIRTWFFVTRGPAEEPALQLADDEAVSAEWVDPAEMLERHARGDVTLYPPTWVTLHALAGQRDVDALIGVLNLAGFGRFETIARRGPGGPVLLWQQDAEYETDASREAAASSARHRLELGSLPWVYTRSD